MDRVQTTAISAVPRSQEQQVKSMKMIRARAFARTLWFRTLKSVSLVLPLCILANP